LIVRAARPISLEPSAKTARGDLLNAWNGPIKSLLNVRVSSQIARNDMEIELERELLLSKFGVELRPYTFCLSGDPPLSWHLTSTETDSILAHWPDAEEPPDWFPEEARAVRESNRVELEELCTAWQ
jgi:hypothetical protein